MLTEICADIKNYFTYEEDKYYGTFTIKNGTIAPPLNYITDYIAIFGSHKNNGVHLISDYDLEDETFNGSIWLMSPPKDFLDLVESIKEWQTKNADIIQSPYTSESFGGYSYTKAADLNTKGYASVFGSSLNRYRRIRL